MRWSSFLAAGLTCLAVLLSDASNAAVDIRVNLATQTMHVVSSDGEVHDWAVSTARKSFVTPRGTYGVQSLQAMHYSRKYHNSPMPHSIFFRGGYAIHGTYSTGSLGRAASHGCIRLSPEHAAILFRMVKAEGARITIGGSSRDTMTASRDERPRRHRVMVASRHWRSAPMAYAPLAPSYNDWLTDPSGY